MKHGFLKSSFFSSTIVEWNNLDYNLRNAPSIIVFKQNILKFIRLGPNKVYNVHKPTGLKLLTRLRLGLSHLCAHKFSHNFSDCLDERILNLQTVSSSNAHYIYPKEKPLWRKSVMLRFLILVQYENYNFYTLLFRNDKLSDFKTFAYSVQVLNISYR